MTRDPITIARENIEAGNAQDWPRFKATLADGVVYDEVGTGRKIKGRRPVGRSLPGLVSGVPGR